MIVQLGTLKNVPSGNNLPETFNPPSGTIRGRPKEEVECNQRLR
jgi:hypothetical protein